MECFVGTAGVGRQLRVGAVAPRRCAAPRWMAAERRQISMPGGRDLGAETEVVAGAAIDPRRPSRGRAQQEQYTEEEPAYGAPESPGRSISFWDVVPLLAIAAAGGTLAWIGGKRWLQRQDELVVQFGEDAAMYGRNITSLREVTNTFKKKLGPGAPFRTPGMYSTFVKEIFTTGTMSADTIERVAEAKRLLGISDVKAAMLFNEVGLEVRSQPSVLTKLLFVAERILDKRALEKLEVRKMFRYDKSTVEELQRSMLEIAYKQACEAALDEDEEDATAPVEEADVLKLSQREAETIFQQARLERIRQREAELDAEAAKQVLQTMPVEIELEEPASMAPKVHAYQCQSCGYTLFPAAGREFKFFGDDFKCPQCGAAKDQFIDVSEEGE